MITLFLFTMIWTAPPKPSVPTPVRTTLRSVWTAWNEVFVLGVPAAPTNLVVADAEDGVHVNIDWMDNSTTETGFEFERQTMVGPIWGPSVFFVVPANTVHWVDSPGEGTHQYRVRAIRE